jgi:flagellin-like protein
MKKTWAIRKDAEAVSPVIATILMVAITVVLAAVLYVMVLGFGGTSAQTPTSSITKVTVTNGVKYTFAPMSKDTPWGDVTVQLTDGTYTLVWSPTTAQLTDATPPGIRNDAAGQALGTLSVYLNITDLAGNGYVNQGDYVIFQTSGASTFSASVTYTVTIMHDPTSAEICHATFNG